MGETLHRRRLLGCVTLAVLLAAAGIYGVMSLSVNGRVQEFGIRAALRAKPGNVLRLVLGMGLRLAMAGVAGALWLARFLASLSFGVTSADPPTFAAAIALLAAVALLACYVPARRATRVDPAVALRNK